MEKTETIAISKFKANCIAVLKRVQWTRKPILVTRFGKPVAEIQPAPAAETPKRRLGGMEGTGRILGDIISPAIDEKDWEALQ